MCNISRMKGSTGTYHRQSNSRSGACVSLVCAALQDRKPPLPQGEGWGEGENPTYQAGTSSSKRMTGVIEGDS